MREPAGVPPGLRCHAQMQFRFLLGSVAWAVVRRCTPVLHGEYRRPQRLLPGVSMASDVVSGRGLRRQLALMPGARGHSPAVDRTLRWSSEPGSGLDRSTAAFLRLRASRSLRPGPRRLGRPDWGIRRVEICLRIGLGHVGGGRVGVARALNPDGLLTLDLGVGASLHQRVEAGFEVAGEFDLPRGGFPTNADVYCGLNRRLCNGDVKRLRRGYCPDACVGAREALRTGSLRRTADPVVG